ncbi:hypothetical protein CRUP_013154 [Coryphaenoides rupestris]|nr:hypothetical protein CRUP_013154 [Coryphaenoides rupestris]
MNAILAFLPKQRRTGLFSATQTQELEKLVRAGLRNPVRITVKEKGVAATANQKTPARLCNYYNSVSSATRGSHSVSFFSTCASVEYYGRALQSLIKNVSIHCIHGKMKNKRNKIFAEFRALKGGILVCTDVMARGIDIPDVNWVLQYDPPSSASAFVHRCGRTARIGNEGSALVFLLPMEESYVTFLSINQKTSMSPGRMGPITGRGRRAAQAEGHGAGDRAIVRPGMRAYVSSVQATPSHECSLIFRVKDLDFSAMAKGFALLRMPRMPELKDKVFPDFVRTEVDTDTIRYKDKAREKARRKLLAELKERGPAPVVKRNLGSDGEDEDLKELLNDTRLLKKLKKGKISEEDFEKQVTDVPMNSTQTGSPQASNSGENDK